MHWLLSIFLFFPLVVGLVVLASGPKTDRCMLGRVAITGALLELALGVLLYALFGSAAPTSPGSVSAYVVEEIYPWIPSIGATYHIGLDGLSLGLSLLTVFLTPIVLWRLHAREGGQAGHFFAVLALETALLGVLLSVDMLLFYVFWEAMLIPMYFLIALWGGEHRARVSLKFILYMMVGSLLMLIGVLWVYWWHHSHTMGFGGQTSPYSFDLIDWVRLNGILPARIPHNVQMWMFFFFWISFAIKVPLFPFHTWLPDAQAEGPIAFNVLLVEVGAYAFLRFCVPLFPDAALTWAPLIMSLAVINIIYGGVMAIVQSDLKRLFAYSSISHAGFMMLGIFSFTTQGMQGALLYMINSGLTTGALYLIADLMYRRRGSRDVADFGGLAASMPLFYFVFMIVALGAIGLPLLNGFTSEFLVLLGSISTTVVSAGYGYAAGAGVVLSAIYMLWMFQRVMYGQLPRRLEGVTDLDASEQASLWPIVVVIFVIGLFSAWLTRPMLPAVDSVLKTVQLAGLNSSVLVPVPDSDQVPTSLQPPETPQSPGPGRRVRPYRGRFAQ